LDLWAKLQTQPVRHKKSLQIALRRFTFASERFNLEDRMIDLLISAEAWLVPGQKDELSHKIAVNAGLFLSKPRDGRATFEFVRRAYTVRSKIVHGDEPAARDLRIEDGSNVGLGAFADAVEGLVKDVLVKAVDEVASGGWANDWQDWLDLIVRPKGGDAPPSPSV
jgi:hypothetical protein